MVSDEWKVNAETTAIRGRSYLRTLFRLIGIGLIVLAGYNALMAPAYDLVVFAPYRTTGEIVITEGGLVYLDDVALFAAGAVITWLV